MEIQQLKCFVKVAEEENITRAAEKLHIAQPAVTQTIKRLEEDLGVELFDRRNRRIYLNEAGKTLYAYAQNALLEQEDIREKIQESSKESKRTITINMLAGSKYITDAIISFREKNPEVIFKLSQFGNDKNTDLEISTSLNPLKENEGYSLKEEIFLASPKGWVNNKTEISLKEAEQFDFISLDSSKQYKIICDYFCHKVDASPKIVFKSDNPQSVRDLISAGLGVGFWPEYTWGKINEENVKLLHISDIECMRYINIRVTTPKKNKIIEDFIEELKRG